MALFFNIEKLEKEAGEDPNKFLALLEYHFTGKLPRNKNTKYKPSKTGLTGSSFILDPAPIFSSRNIDIAYKVQYIKLVACRDYTQYKLYNYAGLDLSFFPDILLDNIRHNPLLEIAGNQIHFKYEELYVQRKKKSLWH